MFKKIKICILGPISLQDLIKKKKKNRLNKSLGASGAPFLSNISRSISKNNNFDVSDNVTTDTSKLLFF